MLTTSGICQCQRCTSRTSDIYRMIGTCTNCMADRILMLFRAGDRAERLTCPICRCSNAVMPIRVATVDEVPSAGEPR